MSTATKSRRPALSDEEKAERKEQITALLDDLNDKVASITTSEEWIAHLDWAARFHRYSFMNQFYLQVQALTREVEVSQFAGFNVWKKQGRSVRKGEKAFKVFAPSKYKVTDEKTQEVRWIVKGYTLASVFDISQTDGPEVPAQVLPIDLVVGGEEAVLEDVVRLITEAGFTFERKIPEGAGVRGYVSFDQKHVVVESGTSTAQAIKTAVHEYTHILLHKPEDVDYQTHRGRCEVEAESTAYVVLKHLGIDADEYSIPYVASWSGASPDAVRKTAATVAKTATQILDALALVEDRQEVAA